MTRPATAFDDDIERYGGYRYIHDARLSTAFSNARLQQALFDAVDFRDLRVLDVGAGDGTHTRSFAEAGAAMVTGLDIAEQAVAAARERHADLPNLRFERGDIQELQASEGGYYPYDIVVLRQMLHHVPQLEQAIRASLTQAPLVLMSEPNGYNPVLKIIEKLSPYHRAHDDKSYCPSTLRRLFARNGGRRVYDAYVGLVPVFCPDWMARLLKRLEPLVERMPGLRAIGCGQYVLLLQSV